MSLFDVFGNEDWEPALDYALSNLERFDDDERVAYTSIVLPIAFSLGWSRLHTYAHLDWTLYGLLHCRPEFATAAELRREVARLRAEVAYQSAEPCPGCGTRVWPGLKGRVYCSNACRQRAYRRRRNVQPAAREQP